MLKGNVSSENLKSALLVICFYLPVYTGLFLVFFYEKKPPQFYEIYKQPIGKNQYVLQ